jgi:hypothetical protein
MLGGGGGVKQSLGTEPTNESTVPAHDARLIQSIVKMIILRDESNCYEKKGAE